jgi:hypothetical protein
MIEPTIVCELDAGRPNHHVPRFHKMAASSRAKTIEKPEQRTENLHSGRTMESTNESSFSSCLRGRYLNLVRQQ